MSDYTYYVAPCEVGNDLCATVTVGTGNEAVTKDSECTGLVLGAETGQVIAVWKFTGAVGLEEASALAFRVAPSWLEICHREDFGMLDLISVHTRNVEVISKI